MLYAFPMLSKFFNAFELVRLTFNESKRTFNWVREEFTFHDLSKKQSVLCGHSP